MTNPKTTSLCLRNTLVADSVPLRTLATDVNNCILTPTDGIVVEDASLAYSYIVANKGKVPKNEDGIRMLMPGDEIRKEVCRIIFHIPLANLCRREGRNLETDPLNSAAHSKPKIVAESEDISFKPVKVKTPAQSGSNQPQVPVYTLETYDTPDDHAFEGYIGNTTGIVTINKHIDGALMRGDPLRPLLLRGQSGCGKTELAKRIARKLGKRCFRVAGSVLKKAEDVYTLIALINVGDVFFIDEAQDMSDKAKAAFYDLTSNESGKEIFIIFATNISAKLPDALKNRCLEIRLTDYSISELSQMVNLTAKECGISVEPGVAEYIAKHCHSVARYAVNYTKDIITENADNGETITMNQTKEFFARRGIDEYGLKDEHRQYIKQLAMLKQASAASLAAALGENDTSEIERGTEPLLLKHGFITITSKGRTLTEAGNKYAQAIIDKEA